MPKHQQKLTSTRFPSWCNVIDDNVVVLDGKLSYESYSTLAFTHRTMLLEGKLTLARFSSCCNDLTNNISLIVSCC